MFDNDGVHLTVCTIFLCGYILIDILVEGVTLIRQCWLFLTTCQNNRVGADVGRIVAVVVQIELDMIVKLADDTARQLVVLQNHRLASVVL